MKKYKFITIYPSGGLRPGGTVYEIINNKSKASLGLIQYYPSWKKYTVAFVETANFDISCLSDIIDFIKNEIPK